MAAPVLSDPVTARLLTRLGADCLQNKIFLLSLVYEAKDEERVNVTIFAHKPKPAAHARKVTWKIGLMAGQAAGLPPGIREGPYLESYIGEDKKHKEAGTLTTRWMTKRKT